MHQLQKSTDFALVRQAPRAFLKNFPLLTKIREASFNSSAQGLPPFYSTPQCCPYSCVVGTSFLTVYCDGITKQLLSDDLKKQQQNSSGIS